jgi:hypothetical protein
MENLIDALIMESPNHQVDREPLDADYEKYGPCECGAHCHSYPNNRGSVRSERDVVALNIRRHGGMLYNAAPEGEPADIRVSRVIASLEAYDSLPAWGTAEAKEAEIRKANATRHPRHAEAVEYVKHYIGSFEFLQSLKTKALEPRFKGFTEKQVIAICKCIDREASWKKREEKPDSGIDLFGILPYGRTRAAVHNDSDGITFLVFDKPDEKSAKWHGWVFVKQQRGPDEEAAKVGTQRPGQSYKGQWGNLIARVAADWKAAAILYGKELGICGVCSSPLTNDESRAKGIGPVCESK